VTDEPKPSPAKKSDLADKAVAGTEAQLLMDIRELSVTRFRLLLAREDRETNAEVVSDAAQAFRTQQRRVSSLVEELTDKHINAIKARAEESTT
jgi:nitrogen regulatory protein PII-like uncharacterized protein